ncbi:hypothetical protein NZD89_28515 (plasmid) [Alicyclobacillus fastidiosus]|uniref:LysM domain-containing protein n=1 Tax=Alicyclobacillus fastidiosus TaxID=392011 RepID=A0ABY6ZP92_9BACL|nr:hypothetical protein [Alicyclobacillus fastidiosus]WAH44803.1 hypothetical protein NZD89_28515 [Alicyclobacillus fastidiosus]GMA65760.1 hypothetical protein GCM10025859_62000 [Alicyclobacillus fastidiosus]GMA65933.1 hypothetical protein GCM10025859_63740 [Alicyclobacillus fastidiosus]
MKIKTMITSSILTLGAVSALGTATVFAATNTHTHASPTKSSHHKVVKNGTEKTSQKNNRISPMSDISNILGISSTTLQSDLKSGQSLAQIAQNQGISEQTLVSDIESAETSQLNQAVQNGKLTSAQEQNILSNLDSHVQQMVEHTGGFQKGNGKWSGATSGTKGSWSKGSSSDAGQQSQLSNLSSILGISQSTLQSDLQSGQSILDIAQNQGISEQTLETDLTNNLQTQLDQAVSNGKLTSTQEQTILNNFSSRIGQMLAQQGGFGQGHNSSSASSSN